MSALAFSDKLRIIRARLCDRHPALSPRSRSKTSDSEVSCKTAISHLKSRRASVEDENSNSCGKAVNVFGYFYRKLRLRLFWQRVRLSVYELSKISKSFASLTQICFFSVAVSGCATIYKEVKVPIKCDIPARERPALDTTRIVEAIKSLLIYTESLEKDLEFCRGENNEI